MIYSITSTYLTKDGLLTQNTVLTADTIAEAISKARKEFFDDRIPAVDAKAQLLHVSIAMHSPSLPNIIEIEPRGAILKCLQA